MFFFFSLPSDVLTTADRLGTSLTEFCTSSSVTSTTVQCSSSRGRRSVPSSVTHGCSCPHIHTQSNTYTYTLKYFSAIFQYDFTLISGNVILVPGTLSSILMMRSFSPSLITGLCSSRAPDLFWFYKIVII